MRPDLAEVQTVPHHVQEGKRVTAVARQWAANHSAQSPRDLAQTLDFDIALAQTRQALESNVETVLEAAFQSKHGRIRVDILRQDPQNKTLQITEVKASTRVKEEHLHDLAFQTMVLADLGSKVSATKLLLINPQYKWDGSTLDLDQLFQEINVTQDVMPCVGRVRAEVKAQIKILQLPTPPPIQPNLHCRRPERCPFFDHCNQPLQDDDITFLPNMTVAKVNELRARGIFKVSQLTSHEGLTAHQARVLQVLQSNKPFVSHRISSPLGRIRYPLAFVDFEAAVAPIPFVPRSRPYQSIPFQWSCHRVEAPKAEPVHHSYLDLHSQDPRPGFVSSLLQALAGANTLVHFSNYEATLADSLAREGIAQADILSRLFQSKSFDLHRLVRENIYFPSFRGSYSIKNVLPALVPELDYSHLEIQDGQAAAAAYLAARNKETDPQLLAPKLEAYCALDTFAMVRLLERVQVIACKA